jgi:hypothetical protein
MFVEPHLDLAAGRRHRDHVAVGDDQTVLGQHHPGTLTTPGLRADVDRDHTREDLVRHRLDGAVRGLPLGLSDAERRRQPRAVAPSGHRGADPPAQASRDEHGRHKAGGQQAAAGLPGRGGPGIAGAVSGLWGVRRGRLPRLAPALVRLPRCAPALAGLDVTVLARLSGVRLPGVRLPGGWLSGVRLSGPIGVPPRRPLTEPSRPRSRTRCPFVSGPGTTRAPIILVLHTHHGSSPRCAPAETGGLVRVSSGGARYPGSSSAPRCRRPGRRGSPRSHRAGSPPV